MKNKSLVGFLSLLLTCSCAEKKKKEIVNSDKGTVTVSETDHISASGKIFKLSESHPKGESLSNLKIETKGFETEFNVTLSDIDPIKKVFFADLDENGFEELYVTTQAAGSGAYSSIYGFASNGDKSVSGIYAPQISEADMAEEGLFAGFMGKDDFLMQNNVLMRQFYQFKEGDTANKPTGDKVTIAYTLNAGEASWNLQAKPTFLAEGTLVKNCLGAFLATEKGNLQICNKEIEAISAFLDGALLNITYVDVPACIIKEEAICGMAFPTTGTIKAVIL
ncbi:hypothetical protein [Maribacter sp. 2308TA10-17]|uniref:hypothetical protein n=1 Tax=Maribacter sp. 2308TA10-17 TaxID=3386276 RepID=UPI0039BC48E0